MCAVIFCMTKSYKVIEKNIEKSKVNFLIRNSVKGNLDFPSENLRSRAPPKYLSLSDRFQASLNAPKYQGYFFSANAQIQFYKHISNEKNNYSKNFV